MPFVVAYVNVYLYVYCKMKTTVEIDDPLFVAAKKHAAELHVPMRVLIERGLRQQIVKLRGDVLKCALKIGFSDFEDADYLFCSRPLGLSIEGEPGSISVESVYGARVEISALFMASASCWALFFRLDRLFMRRDRFLIGFDCIGR